MNKVIIDTICLVQICHESVFIALRLDVEKLIK